MKNHILLSTLGIILIVACTTLISDGLTYLTISLMALSIIAVVRANKSRVLKMTRWAKAKPGKAQGLITGLQFALLGLGIFTGKNLRELGYEFTDITAYVFTAILVIGFLSVPFRRTRGKIVIPKELKRQRLGYLSIILSSLVLTAIIGNRIEDAYPNSPVTQAIETVDQWIFTDHATEQGDFIDQTTGHIPSVNHGQNAAGELTGMAIFVVNPAPGKDKILSRKELKNSRKIERKVKKQERRLRRAVAAGACAAAIVLIIILLAPLCAGICLIIGGWGGASAGAVVGGVLLTAGSIWAIIKVGQWCTKS